MWSEYACVSHLEEALELLDKYQARARIVAGATDLILELERGTRKGVELLIDISRVSGLNQIWVDSNDWVHIGPMVTHNDCVKSSIVQRYAFALAKAAWEVGSPQIRNRGTIAGNLITASPANDTIPPLMALGALVKLQSVSTQRIVPLVDFYRGVRSTVMQDNEIMVDITFPKHEDSRGVFYKFALRKAQAISVVNAAVVMRLTKGIITHAAICLGSVSPTIVFVKEAEDYLIGKHISEIDLNLLGEASIKYAHPIDDIRGSAPYRRKMVSVVVARAVDSIITNREREGFPTNPVTLSTPNSSSLELPIDYKSPGPIVTNINEKNYRFEIGHQKTLLQLLREDAELIGTKEGCSEGECGACTVILDGSAVMSCLVPAARAHGAKITTIEGLSTPTGELNPVQRAFIEYGAVQCGYCTPGFIMSATKLLEEKEFPTRLEIQQAITGNLCRCTGYYKIIEAIEHSMGAMAK